MENTNLTQTESSADHDAILFAALLLKDVHQTIHCIQTVVAWLLRYVAMGVSIMSCLMGWVVPTPYEQN